MGQPDRRSPRGNVAQQFAALLDSNLFITILKMALNVVEYVRQDGANPYRSWFDGLPSQEAAKVATATLRLQMGNTSSVKWFSGIGEYRIDWGPGYRIYLAKDRDDFIILLGGGTKKSREPTSRGRR
jgi:putative addiction module killer protein